MLKSLTSDIWNIIHLVFTDSAKKNKRLYAFGNIYPFDTVKELGIPLIDHRHNRINFIVYIWFYMLSPVNQCQDVGQTLRFTTETLMNVVKGIKSLKYLLVGVF